MAEYINWEREVSELTVHKVFLWNQSDFVCHVYVIYVISIYDYVENFLYIFINI